MDHLTRSTRSPVAPKRSLRSLGTSLPQMGTDWRIFDRMPQAVIITDALGAVVYWNAAATALYGWSPAEALGRPILEVTPSERMQDAAAGIMEALRRGESWQGEFEVCHRDGSRFWAMVSDSPLFDAAGELTGVIGFSWDLTPQRERELALDQARAAAQQAEQHKSEFLATMSHELRTPLTAIMGYEELLARGVGGVEQHQLYLERIRTSANHLRNVIDQVLSLSRILAGKEEVRAETISLAHFTRETAALVEPEAERRGLELRVRMEDCEEMQFETDSGKLRQVLLNLLSNAVKFTAHGHVELRARCTADAVVLEVEDTGIGFSDAEAAAIFEPFRRLPNAENAVGSGLGLAVVERLVYLLGASLSVHSVPGQGSCFTLTLPTPVRRSDTPQTLH